MDASKLFFAVDSLVKLGKSVSPLQKVALLFGQEHISW